MVFFLILASSLLAISQVFIPYSYWAGQDYTSVNECPLTAQGSLSINLNYDSNDATSCSFTSANATALTGTGACSCTSGVCTVTGLTFINSFLAGLPAGTNYTLKNAISYSVTRPSGTFTKSLNLIILSGTWSPTCIGGTLLMWLDATDANTVYQDTAGLTPATNGTTVALWKDKSGYVADANQSTAANRPTYNTGVNTYINFSNNWSSTFNYMNSLLTQSGTSGFNGSVGAMFSVVNTTSTGGNSYISIMGFRPAGGDFTGFSDPNGTTWGMDWYTNGVYNWNTGATISTGSSAIVGWTNTSGSQTFSLNGTTYTNTYSTSSIPSRSTALIIANDPCCGNSRYFNGKIYELLAIKQNLSASLRQQLEGYLAAKYSLTANLPGAHPYKVYAP